MIVIGVDAHKRTHTLVALDAVTGVAPGPDDDPGQRRRCAERAAVRCWLRRDRVWAVEDCRHVTAGSSALCSVLASG